MEWLVEVHSILRWLVVLVGVAAVVVPLVAIATPSLLPTVPRTMGAYAGVVTVQLVIGVVLWLVQGRWDFDSVFLSAIHPLAMVAGVGLAHVGFARTRKAEGVAVAKAGAIFAVASLVVVTAAVPTASWGG